MFWFVMIIAFVLGMYAQIKITAAYNKYSKVATATGVTGYEAARKMLDAHGLQDVAINQVSGTLSDHYSPKDKTLSLSQGVYRGASVAAVGVACHEAGHAYQHAESYGPLSLRSAFVPVVNFGSRLGPILFTVGLILSMLVESDFGYYVAICGIAAFALTVVFALITLPVEFDASKRAKSWLSDSGLVYQQELDGVSEILRAAAMTYVAAAIQAIANVLYYISRLGYTRSRRSRR